MLKLPKNVPFPPHFPPLSPEIIDALGDILITLGKKLWKWFTDEDGDETPELKKNNTAEEIEQMSERLREIRKRVSEAADPVIEAAERYADEYIGTLTEMIKKHTSMLRENQVSLTPFYQIRATLKNSARTFFNERIERCVSFDSSDCRAILMLPGGSLKEKRMSEYITSIVQSVLSDYVSEFRDKVENVCRDFEEDAENATARLEKQLKQYQTMEEAAQQHDTAKIENTIYMAALRLACIEVLEMKMEA